MQSVLTVHYLSAYLRGNALSERNETESHNSEFILLIAM